MIMSGPDKFLGTDLEKILKGRRTQTPITVGTASHGAVLYTGSEAALRGLKVIGPLVCAGFFVFVTGCGVTGLQPGTTATASASPPLSGPPVTPSAAAPLQAIPPTLCPYPLAIIKAFYDANDASQFEASLGFFTEDATLSSWAEGVNGHHMREEHLTGKEQIRPVLGNPGLRRTSDQPDGPIYHESRVRVSGDQVFFVLEPDRLRPNGKPYNPYRVEVVFLGCKIKSLTVIDLVTWL